MLLINEWVTWEYVISYTYSSILVLIMFRWYILIWVFIWALSGSPCWGIINLIFVPSLVCKTSDFKTPSNTSKKTVWKSMRKRVPRVGILQGYQGVEVLNSKFDYGWFIFRYEEPLVNILLAPPLWWNYSSNIHIERESHNIIKPIICGPRTKKGNIAHAEHGGG